MDYIYFEGDQARNLKAKRLFSTPIDPSRSWDLDTLDRHDLLEELIDLVSYPYIEDHFVDKGLWNLFQQSSIIYKELLIEFLASFRMEEGPRDKGFNTRKCITFRLSQREHKLNFIEFAKGVGIVDADQDEIVYKTHLDKASSGTPPGFDMVKLWSDIGMTPFDSLTIMECNLLNPLFRLAHRFLATTILFHPHQAMVNPLQLQGLWYILHPESRWHLPHALALMFKRASKEEFKVLPGGQFITHLAQHLGVLDSYAMYACTPINPIDIGLPFYVEMMVLKKMSGDKYRVYKEEEPKEEEGEGDSSIIWNEGELDMKRLSKQVDRLGWYLDDINRQNAKNPNIPLVPFWNERMGYFGEGSKK